VKENRAAEPIPTLRTRAAIGGMPQAHVSSKRLDTSLRSHLASTGPTPTCRRTASRATHPARPPRRPQLRASPNEERRHIDYTCVKPLTKKTNRNGIDHPRRRMQDRQTVERAGRRSSLPDHTPPANPLEMQSHPISVLYTRRMDRHPRPRFIIHRTGGRRRLHGADDPA